MRQKLTRIFCAFALVLFMASVVARAEYRVYQLGVTYGPGAPEVMVLSTLDHYQYPSYYQLTNTQTTRLVDHWLCPDDTSNYKAYCVNPKTLNPQGQNPATTPAAPANPVM